MVRKTLNILLSVLGFFCFVNLHSYSIVFVHIGPDLPSHISDAALQARFFNTTEDIYLLANQDALNKSDKQELLKKMQNEINVKVISIETLKRSNEHAVFEKKSTHNVKSRKGFWKFTTERFFVLDDFMQQYKINDVVHLESDTLLYRNLEELMPIFRLYYKGIAAVFINDVYCIPCFVYFRNKKAIKNLVKYIAERAAEGKNDMIMLSGFKENNSAQVIDSLPIISPMYVKLHELKSIKGHSTHNQEKYYKNIVEFKSIFDGNAIGQYLGGRDPSTGPSGAGIINKNSLFDPSILIYQWEKDELGRNVPFMLFNDERYRINNLHIHSKDLKKFLSV
ncbi:MAG: hypothetical protein V1646_05040 [bacterium]